MQLFERVHRPKKTPRSYKNDPQNYHALIQEPILLRNGATNIVNLAPDRYPVGGIHQRDGDA